MINIGDFTYIKRNSAYVGYLRHNCGKGFECVFRFEWNGSSWFIKRSAYTHPGHTITVEEEQKVLFALNLPPL